ncbi:MAG TPA: hypothetical protein VD793_08335 [Gemmatimonadales bacterium]|nr:hypothetical protein [Gemmatimonadales bacterium]
MATEGGGNSKRSGFEPPLSDIRTRQMGELKRGDARWDVLLEIVRDESVNALRGRIHFVAGNAHRLSGWIFLEWSEKEMQERFTDFSAQELWNLLDSLAG